MGYRINRKRSRASETKAAANKEHNEKGRIFAGYACCDPGRRDCAQNLEALRSVFLSHFVWNASSALFELYIFISL